MARCFRITVSLMFVALVALSAGCGGDGGESNGTATATGTVAATAAGTSAATPSGAAAALDIKDFDTARFVTSQTTTTGTETSSLSGSGVIDNRQQALKVSYEGVGGEIIAIGRTIYSYSDEQQRWTRFQESPQGRVGFGRPYWPQYWLDAVGVEELGGQTLQGVETVGYRLTFDAQQVGERLQSPGATQPVDVTQAEVEVWVDEDTRYAVRLIFRLSLDLGAQSTGIEITSDFSDFGTDVQIEAPEVATPTPTPTAG